MMINGVTEIDAAPLVLDEIAEPYLARKVTAMVEAGDARWELDPEVEGVVGLRVLNHDDKPIVLVLYLKQKDFEMDARFEVMETPW